MYNMFDNHGHVGHLRSGCIRCYNHCSNATANQFKWCINIFSHEEKIELCLDLESRNSSVGAQAAGLSDHFEVSEVSFLIVHMYIFCVPTQLHVYSHN